MLRTHPLFRFSFLTSLALLLLMTLLPLWKLSPDAGEQAQIPLHYNVVFGVDLIGPWYNIFVLPALGLILLFANTLFQRQLYQKERVLSYFFAVGTLLAEITLFVSVLLIVLLNL